MVWSAGSFVYLRKNRYLIDIYKKIRKLKIRPEGGESWVGRLVGKRKAFKESVTSKRIFRKK